MLFCSCPNQRLLSARLDVFSGRLSCPWRPRGALRCSFYIWRLQKNPASLSCAASVQSDVRRGGLREASITLAEWLERLSSRPLWRSLGPPPLLDVYGARALFFKDAHKYHIPSGLFFVSDVSQLLSDAEKWVNFIPNMVRRHLFGVVEQVFDFKAPIVLSNNSLHLYDIFFYSQSCYL